MKDGRRSTAVGSASLVHGLRVSSPGRRRRSTSWFHRFGLPTDDWRLISSSVYRLPSTLLLLSVICLLTSVFFNCSSPTAPPPPPPPGADTTSHEFTWQVDTFGDANTSHLYDVAIISDSVAWAVGDISLHDSTGAWDGIINNLARWEAGKWSIDRVYSEWQGNRYTQPIYTVFSLSPTDVWASGAVPHQWNGSTWQDRVVTGGTSARPIKLWVARRNDVYLVGYQGMAIHFDGTTWTPLSTGTNVHILDIWGVVDKQSGSRTVLCAASFIYDEGEKKILRINEDNTVDTVAWGTGRRVSSVWFENSSRLFAAGGGVFVQSNNESWKEVTELPLIFTRRVRGNADNDVFVVGDFGYVAHFNGASWHYYTDRELPSFYGSWASVSIKGDLVVAVGSIGEQAAMLVGRRR